MRSRLTQSISMIYQPSIHALEQTAGGFNLFHGTLNQSFASSVAWLSPPFRPASSRETQGA